MYVSLPIENASFRCLHSLRYNARKKQTFNPLCYVSNPKVLLVHGHGEGLALEYSLSRSFQFRQGRFGGFVRRSYSTAVIPIRFLFSVVPDCKKTLHHRADRTPECPRVHRRLHRQNTRPVCLPALWRFEQKIRFVQELSKYVNQVFHLFILGLITVTILFPVAASTTTCGFPGSRVFWTVTVVPSGGGVIFLMLSP